MICTCFKIESLNLIVETFEGEINKGDLNNITDLLLINRKSDCESFLMDIRKVKVLHISDFFEELCNLYDTLFSNSVQSNRKIAFVTNTPDQVVASYKYMELAHGKLGYYKVYSTIENALNHLKINNEDIRILINNIYDNPQNYAYLNKRTTKYYWKIAL